jgi:rubrerythrin
MKEPYVELLECNLYEAKEIARLLEPEGITCLFERTLGSESRQPLQREARFNKQEGLVLKVPADEYSKARALLAWELQEEIEEETGETDEPDENELLACPACQTELDESSEVCPECGESVLTESEDLPEDESRRVFRCSACGVPCESHDWACPSCRARLDH